MNRFQPVPTRYPGGASPGSHYPSWGSETFGHGKHPIALGLALITPHGDRKLWTPTNSEEVIAWYLITPHGDRKLGAVGVPEDGMISLPLMGIGN